MSGNAELAVAAIGAGLSSVRKVLGFHVPTKGVAEVAGSGDSTRVCTGREQ